MDVGTLCGFMRQRDFLDLLPAVGLNTRQGVFWFGLVWFGWWGPAAVDL